MFKILKEKNIRMIWSKEGNEVWFNASDIGEELGVVNIRKVLPNIDSEYKRKFKNSDVHKSYNSKVTKGYNSNLQGPLYNTGEIFLTEEAVYQIAFRSNKAEAKLFTKWVSRVLKEIRINGYYIALEKDDQWLGIRGEGKETRRAFTDEIEEFVYYATQQGSNRPNMYYIHFTRLVNDKLGIPKGVDRDEMSQNTLMDIMALERVMSMKLQKLIKTNTNYKEVYKKIKELIAEI